MHAPNIAYVVGYEFLTTVIRKSSGRLVCNAVWVGDYPTFR
jgi:hypothetical protein